MVGQVVDKLLSHPRALSVLFGCLSLFAFLTWILIATAFMSDAWAHSTTIEGDNTLNSMRQSYGLFSHTWSAWGKEASGFFKSDLGKDIFEESCKDSLLRDSNEVPVYSGKDPVCTADFASLSCTCPYPDLLEVLVQLERNTCTYSKCIQKGEKGKNLTCTNWPKGQQGSAGSPKYCTGCSNKTAIEQYGYMFPNNFYYWDDTYGNFGSATAVLVLSLVAFLLVNTLSCLGVFQTQVRKKWQLPAGLFIMSCLGFLMIFAGLIVAERATTATAVGEAHCGSTDSRTDFAKYSGFDPKNAAITMGTSYRQTVAAIFFSLFSMVSAFLCGLAVKRLYYRGEEGERSSLPISKPAQSAPPPASSNPATGAASASPPGSPGVSFRGEEGL